MGNAARGVSLYQGASLGCISCHGTDGVKGGAGGAIYSLNVSNFASVADLSAYISANMPKGAAGACNAQCGADIAQYLQSWLTPPTSCDTANSSTGTGSTGAGLCELKFSTAAKLSIAPVRDDAAVLHNPAMGLTKYFYGKWDYKPEWVFGDARLDAYTNILYIRTTWAALEPTEGNYVWLHDVGFMNIVQAAKDHGHRLAFRVMVQDGSPATPAYVTDAIKAAGQDPYTHNTAQPNYPDLTNAIWQQKFKTFITAFGQAFNDPAVVDYIDANGTGQWGEGNQHGIPLSLQAAYYDWHLGVYASAFNKVLLVINGSQFGAVPAELDQSLGLDKYAAIYRRDGLGSRWISTADLGLMQKNYPAVPLIGEQCWGVGGWWDTQTHTWNEDPVVLAKAAPAAPTLQTYMNLIIDQSIALHANTLDFGNPEVWVDKNPDILARLVANLGYRYRPSRIAYPESVPTGWGMHIEHSWTNDGVGAMPNANVRWGKKYAFAFALFKAGEATPVETFIFNAADPGALVKGVNSSMTTAVAWKAGAGNYQLAVGIIDQTRPAAPSLELAIKGLERRSGWYALGDLRID